MEAREAKRDAEMQQITQRLEEGIRTYLTSDHYTRYLNTMSRFHNYSINNILMITMQRPDATLVAGYSAWQKYFHRHVKKGEKGIRIIAPVKSKQTHRQPRMDVLTNRPLLGPGGEPVMEEVTVTVPRFRPAVVFDISQTDGEPLPEVKVTELAQRVPGFDRFREAFRRCAPVPVRFEEMAPDARGYYDGGARQIVIRSGMSDAQTMKTMVHELAHAMMHDPEYLAQAGETKDAATREVEAESVAYTVCAHFGLDTSDYSFPYISAWSGSRQPETLRASMEQIRSAASGCIGAMEEQFRVMDRELAAEELADRIMTVYRDIVPYSYDGMTQAEIGRERDGLRDALAAGDTEDTFMSLYEILETRSDLTPAQTTEVKALLDAVGAQREQGTFGIRSETERERE